MRCDFFTDVKAMDRPESPRRFLSDDLKGLDAKRLQIECRLSAKIDAEVYRPKERTQEGSIDSVAPNIARVLHQVFGSRQRNSAKACFSQACFSCEKLEKKRCLPPESTVRYVTDDGWGFNILVFSLSSHRHSYIGLVFSFRFIDS
jgi:hypothetical protein